MRANFSTRLEALEAKASPEKGLLMIVGPYPKDEDPAPHVAEARERWRSIHGEWPSADVRSMHIHLVGVKPGGARHAR